MGRFGAGSRAETGSLAATRSTEDPVSSHLVHTPTLVAKCAVKDGASEEPVCAGHHQCSGGWMGVEAVPFPSTLPTLPRWAVLLPQLLTLSALTGSMNRKNRS